MNRNFKCRLQRIRYGFLMMPHIAVALVLTLASTVIFSRIPPISALVLLTLELLSLLLLKRLTLPTRLTECFSLYPIPFCTWRVIAQHRPSKKKACRDILRALTNEAYLLPGRIPYGRYKVITHDTVLRRIEAADELHVCNVIPLGQDNLMSLHAQMRGANCRRCSHKRNCRYLPMIQEYRQFYFIEFEKISSSIIARQFR